MTHSFPPRLSSVLASSAELVERFARQLGEVGFGILRLTVIIPTLHPQLASNAFVWRRGQSVADAHDLPPYGLQSDAHLKRPRLRLFPSEERRGGTQCVRPRRSPWWPSP